MCSDRVKLAHERREVAERWFSQHELDEMSRPTMDRAIEAIERGDLEAAKELCEEMKHEWQLLHDLMAGGMAGLVSFVQERLGDDGVEEAWEFSLERGWKLACGGDREAGPPLDGPCARGQLARAFVQRHRTAPRRLHDHRGRREVHVRDEPVRVGTAAVAQRRVRGAERIRRHRTRRTTGATVARAFPSTAPTAPS